MRAEILAGIWMTIDPVSWNSGCAKKTAKATLKLKAKSVGTGSLTDVVISEVPNSRPWGMLFGRLRRRDADSSCCNDDKEDMCEMIFSLDDQRITSKAEAPRASTDLARRAVPVVVGPEYLPESTSMRMRELGCCGVTK